MTGARPLRLEALEQLLEQRASLHAAMARSHPALARGLVQCVDCDRQLTVDAVQCLRSGWPRCCGQTMRLVTEGTTEHAGGDRGGGTPPPGPPHEAGEGEARAASRSLIGGNDGGASPTSGGAAE